MLLSGGGGGFGVFWGFWVFFLGFWGVFLGFFSGFLGFLSGFLFGFFFCVTTRFGLELVPSEDVVCHPDGYLLSRDGVEGGCAGRDSGFVFLKFCAF